VFDKGFLLEELAHNLLKLHESAVPSVNRTRAVC
jgi:hypothetical protein